MKPRRSLKVLAGLAGLSLLLLFAFPATRPIAKQQFGLVLGLMPPQALVPPPTPGMEGAKHLLNARKADYDRVALRSPDDIGLQMANAVSDISFRVGAYENDVVERLRPMLRRYPNRPALLANLLIYGGSLLPGQTQDRIPPDATDAPLRDIPATLASAEAARIAFSEFDAWGAAGERADPRNAFFPMMRARGYFEAGRVADALGALSRAASKPAWADYELAPLKGTFDLLQSAYGRTEPTAGVGLMAYSLGPAPQLRATTRHALDEAIAHERGGRREDGFRIRWDLMRVARTWREGAVTYIDFMVATAASELALSKLPGIQMSRDKSVPFRRRQGEYRAKALTYLTSMGHRDEAVWAARDAAERDKRFALLRRGFDRFGIVGPLTKAIAAFSGGLALLAGAVWVLLFTALAAWESREKRAGHRTRGTAVAFAIFFAVLGWQARLTGPTLSVIGPRSDVSAWLLSTGAMALTFLGIWLVGMAIRGIVRWPVRRKDPDRASRLMVGWGLPAGLVLLLLYAGITAATAPAQNRWRDYVTQSAVNECAFFLNEAGGQ